MRGDDHGTTRVRRWPTRRHRRNRLIRRIAAVVLIVFFAIGLSAVALNYLSPSLTRSSEIKNAIHWEAVDARKLRLTSESTPRPNAARMRPVYPYSVVPGGVEDARELKWVAEHDPIVAEHYRGFDYDHARVVRLALAQTVFVSYRIGNHVYWTRHRITLRKGEKLITDGKITARARCANRVEELPQQLHSAPEPAVAEFEEPIGPSQGSSMAIPPVEFESALLNRPGMPGAPALPPLSLYSAFPVGSGVSISPPPLPSGVCAPVKKPGKGEVAVFGEMSKKKKPTGPCGSVGGTAPEPGTWLLLITGLIAVGWIARRRAIVV
ncbi:MAG TPA: PEP-CTERM sorting domain-containing protein [Candidatus Sulfotelmatobacter sp.]